MITTYDMVAAVQTKILESVATQNKIALIIFIILGGIIVLMAIVNMVNGNDITPDGYEIDWTQSGWLTGIVYKPKPPKAIVVETKHDKETGTTTSVIIVPATINVNDLKIKVDNTLQPVNPTQNQPTAENTEKHRRFHEPNFDDITCREPSYEGMIGHEPNFDIDSYDEIDEPVAVVQNIEPNYDSCDGHEPSYD